MRIIKEILRAGKEASKYPSSCKNSKDWNKVEKEIERQEKAEETEGEAAVNALFQKIYGNGSDEVRRAMNKSFVSEIMFIVNKLSDNKNWLIYEVVCFFTKNVK